MLAPMTNTTMNTAIQTYNINDFDLNYFGLNYRNPSQPEKRILVIDDDVDTADAIRFIIESFSSDIECQVVNDPYEALIMLSDQSFDLILVDQKMPGLYGSNILMKMDEQIDQDPLISESGHYTTPVPAVIMSGSDIKLGRPYNLKNFNLLKVLNKRDLRLFLTETFLN